MTDLKQTTERLITALKGFPAFVWNGGCWVQTVGTEPMCQQAADHIERLQAEVDRLKTTPRIPPGWLRAIDEALVGAHLGVADASDDYETAKQKLNTLLCWERSVATDPAVNGGWKLVPESAAPSQLDAAVAFALSVCLSSEYGWSAYMADLYSRFISFSPEPAP